MKNLIIAACLSAVAAAPAAADNWPQWRGADRTDVSKETGLLKSWPEGGPKQVWMNKDAGLGYAGFAVVGDTLYTMGLRDNAEHLIALNVKDGSQKWTAPMGPALTNGWGDGPRGTPTVDGDRVYGLSGKGHLVCAKAADGSVVWKAAMADFGGKVPGWGYTESVLVDGDKVVCTPGGSKGAVVALDKQTGKLAWQSKDFTEPAQYSSIVPASLGGKRQYVQLTMSKLVGLDPATGGTLWTSDWPGKTAVIPTPIVHGDHVYVTSGYGVGCKLVKVEGGTKPTDVYQNTNMVNHHGGVVLVGEHLYGHSDKGGWTCQELKTGKPVWTEKKLEKGAVTAAGGMLYLQGEKTGQVVLIEASPAGWKEHGRFTLKPQSEQRNPKGAIWTHPVVADGKLYLRDQELLFCFDVKGQ
ncbi:MAG: probable polyvinylalcohol dehydrogenase [uncultured Phycisphaerae bacterium]|uniref:Probable polyvinylalcohol dehydrogenase n=1 Tax=uncultured Phycisphaerae bacterium TaxID=904963 RepID=A0A6J4QBA6_9BACT|nr:MAG: probable polyvinylalcohol dehydrogenase [uncultured Phycisphaerae bacterium]